MTNSPSGSETKRGDCGENLYMHDGEELELKSSNIATESWYNNMEFYDFSNGTPIDNE